jgi:3alpha(or 20beta)-hydroxysteroid dehydrogenase
MTRGRNAVGVEGKIIVVTGAASGQGEAEAAFLASRGARVIAADVAYAESESLADEALVRWGLDVAARASWAHLTQAISATHGRIDGLVNNAAVSAPGRLLEVDAEEWDHVLRVNLTGQLLGIQALAPLMPSGSAIVNVCSFAALSGHPPVAYTTAKWGLRGLSRVASNELGPRGIRVNAIFPGFVDTPMVRQAPPEFREITLGEIPLGRVGTPDDVAPLVAFLLGDESGWISGAEIAVDGGEWAHGGTKRFLDMFRAAGAA